MGRPPRPDLQHLFPPYETECKQNKKDPRGEKRISYLVGLWMSQLTMGRFICVSNERRDHDLQPLVQMKQRSLSGKDAPIKADHLHKRLCRELGSLHPGIS